MSISMLYSTFEQELVVYLHSKLPDLPTHTTQEIGAHITNKTIILINDMIREYDRELKLQISKGKRRYKNEFTKDEE